MENTETKAKISKETANRDFESWADALGIEYDMDEYSKIFGERTFSPEKISESVDELYKKL